MKQCPNHPPSVGIAAELPVSDLSHPQDQDPKGLTSTGRVGIVVRDEDLVCLRVDRQLGGTLDLPQRRLQLVELAL